MNGTQWPIRYNIVRQANYMTSVAQVGSGVFAGVTQFNQNDAIRQGTAGHAQLALGAFGLPSCGATACGPCFKDF
jgi:hypothetical protein